MRSGQIGVDVNFTLPAFSIGSVVALVVLLLAIVFMAMGKLDLTTGCLLGGLAVARLS